MILCYEFLSHDFDGPLGHWSYQSVSGLHGVTACLAPGAALQKNLTASEPRFAVPFFFF
jgi:hypothetical protein